MKRTERVESAPPKLWSLAAVRDEHEHVRFVQSYDDNCLKAISTSPSLCDKLTFGARMRLLNESACNVEIKHGHCAVRKPKQSGYLRNSGRCEVRGILL